MKKLFIFLASFYSLVIWLCSCEKATYTNPAESIAGTWKLTSEGWDKDYNGRPDGELSAIAGQAHTLVLRSDGTGEKVTPDNTTALSWEVTDNDLLIREGAVSSHFIIRKIASSELLLLSPDDSISKWLDYSKDIPAKELARGKWKFTNFMYDINSNGAPDDSLYTFPFTSTLELKEDGSGVYDSAGVLKSGQWELKENDTKLVVKSADVTIDGEYVIRTLTASDLIFEDSRTGLRRWTYLKRQ